MKVLAALACFASLIVTTPSLAIAHTVGFEFEDYLHAWPINAPVGSIISYPAVANTKPQISVRFDTRKGYKDLEVHLGPFSTDAYPGGMFDNYAAFYAHVNGAVDTAPTGTLATWYDYKVVDTFNISAKEYPLAYVTRFLKGDIPNKTIPSPALSDVGAQATFSLGTREVYAFFKAAATDKHFPYLRSDTIARVEQFDKIDSEIEKYADGCPTNPKNATVYGCSVRARGFTYFLAEYLSNTVNSLNYANLAPTEVKKESYPLLLRNIEDGINGVKEYYNTIVAHDAYISGHHAQFNAELKSMLAEMVIPMKANTSSLSTEKLVDAYVDFLASGASTGFTYGPKDTYGFGIFTFTTIGEAQDAVIKSPLKDEIYLEARAIRNLTTAKVHDTNSNATIDTYAVSYEEAVAAAKAVADYLKDFHEDTGVPDVH